MMGSSGIIECGNTTPMETSVPPAAPIVDSELPSAFQLALEQVTLPLELAPMATAPLEMPLLEAQAQIPTTTLPSSTVELPVTTETPETPKAFATMETKKPREETGEDEVVPTPSTSLSALPLAIPLPILGSPTEPVATAETTETAEAEGVSSLPHTTAPEAPLVNAPSQELADALAGLTPTSPADSEELELAIDALAPQREPTKPEQPTEQPHVVSSPAPLATAPTTTAPLSATVTGPAVSATAGQQEAPVTTVRLPELPQQLVPMLRRVNEEGNQEIRVRLDPPHLGELNVLIESGKEGLTVRVVAQTRETLLLLQDQRSILQAELSRQNFSVASFTASLAGDSSGQRSLPHFFSPSPRRSSPDSAALPTELSSVALRIPLHTGGLDAHA